MKVGDYVRTINGIVKISEIKNGVMRDDEDSLHFGDFIKSRPNIIDLIEVGDYINGKYVDKYQGKLGVFCELPNGKWEFIELTNEHYLISSIVTKEQFSCMEYKIGE